MNEMKNTSAIANILESEYILSPKVTKAKQKRIKKQLIEDQKTTKTQKKFNQIQANIAAVEDAHTRRPRSLTSESYCKCMHLNMLSLALKKYHSILQLMMLH